MKTRVLKVLLACFAFLIFFDNAKAQEVLYTSSNTYYWNPFEPTTNLGVFNNNQTATTTVAVSNTTPLNGSYSLKSVNNNVTTPANGGVWGSIVPVGTDVATNNFEWTFLYKFTGATANIVDYLSPIAKNSAGWRYWVVSNSKTPGTTGVGNLGIFFTQIGSQLQCYSKESSDQYRNLNLNYTLTAGTTYSIKLKRINSGGTYVIYVDPVTVTTPEAITNRLQINFAGGLGTYSYSVLESNDGRTAANGTFQWDDFKMFQPYESIANVPFTPSSTTLYPGTSSVIAAEYSVTLRDVINIKNSYIYNTIGPMSSYISAARLYVSTTNSFASATLLSPNSAVTDYQFINNSSTSNNLANSDQTGATYYYFVVLDMASSYPSGGSTSFNLSNPNVAYDNNNGYVYNLSLTANAPIFTLATPSAPTVNTTTPVTNIYGGTGTVGGSITATGGSTVTEYGIAYSSTATTPSISDGKFLMGNGATGTTTYSAPLQGLSPNTVYYIRAYATNSTGTSYGSVVTFKTLAPPDLSYSPATQTYTVNTNVGSIGITNNGGAVPANTYLATSTFKSGLSNYFIAFDAAGNLYESDITSIIKITPAGVQTTIASGFYTASTQTGIAVDAAGNIYVGTTGNVIYKVTQAGTVSTFISSATLNQPYGMVFDNLGNLYIASYTGNTILKVAAGTTTLTTYASGFNGPYALDIDANGKIYEADRTGNKIYSVVGGVKTQVTGTFNGPTGIAVAADGTIYFSSISLSNNVFAVPPGSSTAATILASGLNTPRSTILDNTGNFLYISNSSDLGTGNIIKQSVTGYTYTGTLPAGLSFDYTTGTVTGTATALTPAAGNTITVTGYNSAGNDVTTLTIIVAPVPPTVTGTTTLCGAGTTTLTASGGLPTGGVYNWYSAPTGGTAIASTAAYTPFIGGTTPLYVSYTPTGAPTSARTLVTVTVNQKVSSSINSPMISYPFESGSLTDWSVLGNNAVISTAATTIAPALTADRNGMANSAYLFAGTNSTPSYIYSSVNYSQMPLVFSYSLWFKTTVGGGRLLGYSGQQNGDDATLTNAKHDRDLYMADDGRLGFSIYTTLSSHVQGIVTTTKYNDGLWHHVIVTLGNTNGMRLYVDGVWANSSTPYTSYVAPQTGSGYWRIGGDATNATVTSTNKYFNGTIDDVAIYNYELSAADAASNDMNLYKFSAGYCANNPISVMAQTITGASYAWVDNDNATITSAVNPALFTNATSTFYKLTVNSGGCPSTANVTPNNLTYTWTGAASTDFTGPLNTTNWTNTSTNSLNQNPLFNGTESIVIPGTGITNYPVLSATNYNIFSLTMASGATLNLNGKTLNIGCNILNSNGGQILYNANTASKITWGGALASQNYYGSATVNSGQTADMEINNSVAGTVTFRTGVFDAYDLVKLTSGNLVIASPATFTLKSLSTLTASIDVIPSSYSITGNVNAERYVTGGVIARRGYRLLSTPVNQGVITGTTINGYGFTDLQKTTPITGYTASGAAYSSVTVPTNAFDQSLLGNPTVFFYNEADIDPINQQFINSDYKGIASISEKLPVGNGFLFFFRGDRTVNSSVNGANKTSTSSVPENTTLKWTGVLNQGPISVSIPATSSVIADGSGHKVYKTPTTAAGFSTSLGYTSVASSLNNGMHLIGNPYASSIDLELITIGNPSTNKFIYMLNNSNTFGVYTKGSTGSANNGASRYVASGQGFFVVGNSTGTTTVSFTEAAKVNTVAAAAAPTTFMTTNKPTLLAMAKTGAMDLAFNASSVINATPVQTAAPAVVNITLLRDSDNMNETVIQFGDKSTPGSNKYNQAEDAIYRSGISQTTFMASYTADNKPCIINTMGALDTVKSVPLYVEGNVDGLYKLNFKGAKTIDSRYILYLVDHFMKDSLDLSTNDTYNFNLQRGNPQTFGATRFELVKHKSGLQYNLLGFNGAKKTGSVVLNWKTEHEGTYTVFALQRSTDGGKTFITIDSLASDGSGNYTMTDVKPANGTNQYRLVQTVGLDPSALSKIVTIGYQPAGNNNLIANFDLFPNPSVDIIKLRLNNITQGKLSIKIYNVDGRVVSNSKADAGGTISQDVSKLLHGGYVLEVSNADGSYYATKKFSKL